MKYKLNIVSAFTDKYTDENYNVGDVVTFDKARGEELLADPRGLVTLVEKIEQSPKKKHKRKTQPTSKK